MDEENRSYVLSENDYESFCSYAAPMVGRYELHEWQWPVTSERAVYNVKEYRNHSGN
jgi:hypothetical protein